MPTAPRGPSLHARFRIVADAIREMRERAEAQEAALILLHAATLARLARLSPDPPAELSHLGAELLAMVGSLAPDGAEGQAARIIERALAAAEAGLREAPSSPRKPPAPRSPRPSDG
jgi:hypothetical protein